MPFRDFLGNGSSYPFSLELNNSDGSGEQKTVIKMSSGKDLIEESIWIILATEPGERLMRPDFGAGLNRLTFAENNVTTQTRIIDRIEEALLKWEPRIEVLDVNVYSDTDERNKLNIDIEYLIISSNSKRNLVFPFYLQGAE